ncbi:rhodanese-like domain-containing protein [Haloferula sp.]|uniref:rhodanese-like domain-containing protein n=1 Tax=Haloferula sp. TaxID=2497595 RepID=UPI00329B3A3A
MKTLIQIITALLVFAALSSCTSPSSSEPDPPAVPSTPPTKTPNSEPAPEPKPKAAAVKEIDITQLFTLQTEGEALVYDVRLPLYYKLGHIEGAILFYPKPFDEAFAEEKPRMESALKEGKTIVIYCGGADCHDSHIVGKMIAERGIPVSVYPGGWAEWKEVGIE